MAIAAWFAATSAFAQALDQPPPATKSLWTLTGDFGALGEVYRISGRENRRPNETGRVFLRPTLTLADRYTIRSEFLLSTEGSSALTRHGLNQYMVNPSWAWNNTRYSARLGDFSDAYSPTTFNGVQVRGGELAVQRDRLQVTVLGGRTKPATEGGADGGSYRQTLMAGRVGYGDDARSVAAFILYADDNGGSLPVLPDTAGAIDSTEVGTAINPYTVTPQQNLVVAAWGHVNLLERTLSLAGELSRSSYTRDRRAAEDASGRVDYALDTKARYKRQRYEVMGGYRRIGPGYVSLGVSSMHSDQQELLAGGALRVGSRTSLRAQVSRQNDNLANQKEATTVRYRYVTALGLRPANMWTVSLTGNYVTMANDLPNDSTRIDFNAWILGMNHVISFGQRRRLQSTSVGYTIQKSSDDSPLRANSDAESHAVNGRATIRLARSVMASPGIGLTAVHTGGQSWRRTVTYSLALQHVALHNRLASTLSSSISTAAGDASFVNMLGSRYSVTRTDAIQLRLAMNNFRGAASPTAAEGDYDEYTSSLGWSHRF